MRRIVGFLAAESVQSTDSIRETVTRITNRLSHGGPNDFGLWCDAAAAMESIYRMPAAARETLGQESRQKIEREFSLDAVIGQYQKLYLDTFVAVGN